MHETMGVSVPSFNFQIGLEHGQDVRATRTKHVHGQLRLPREHLLVTLERVRVGWVVMGNGGERVC